MAAGEVRATSFGQVAGDYDRVRPGTPEALDWLVPQNCEIAVDIAAGTGVFTRALQRRAAHVIAVEPDDRMRAVLAARSPGVRALAGRGEAIPAPDASAGKARSAVTGGGSRAGRYAGRTRIALRAATRMAADSRPHSPGRRTLSWSSPLVFCVPPADAPQGGDGGGCQSLLLA